MLRTSMSDPIRKNVHTLLNVPLVDNRVHDSMSEYYIPLSPRVPVWNVSVISSVQRVALLKNFDLHDQHGSRTHSFVAGLSVGLCCLCQQQLIRLRCPPVYRPI